MLGKDFWKKFLRRRAEIWGELPDPGISIEFGLVARDAKVNNRNPRKAFAVNLNVDLERLFALYTSEEIEAYVAGTDDFGRPVPTIPISKTSSTIWFDFASAGLELPYDGRDLSLAEFVNDFCRTLKDEMLPRREQFNYLHLDRAEDLILQRISWLPELKSWYPYFLDKPRSSGESSRVP